MPATVDRYRGDGLEDERDRTLRALEGMRDGGDDDIQYGEDAGGFDGESEPAPGNEDLFLNLARATSTSRSERRRVSPVFYKTLHRTLYFVHSR